MYHNLNWFSTYKPLSLNVLWPINAIISHQIFVAKAQIIQLLVQLPDMSEVYLFKMSFMYKFAM